MAKKNIKFNFSGLQTNQFAIIKEAYDEEAPIKIKYGVGVDAEKETKSLLFRFRCEFTVNDNPFLIIAVTGEFKISPEDWKKSLNEDEEVLEIPKGFVLHMGVLTVGAARGILHAKVERTPFFNFVLPTLNLTEVIKEDPVIIEMNSDKQVNHG